MPSVSQPLAEMVGEVGLAAAVHADESDEAAAGQGVRWPGKQRLDRPVPAGPGAGIGLHGRPDQAGAHQEPWQAGRALGDEAREQVRILRHARRIQGDDRPPGKAALDDDERDLGDRDAERQQEDVAQGQALAELGRVQHARGAADAMAPGAAPDAAEQAEEAGPTTVGTEQQQELGIEALRHRGLEALQRQPGAAQLKRRPEIDDARARAAGRQRQPGRLDLRRHQPPARQAQGPVPHARGVAQIDHLGGPAPAVAVAENEARQQGIEQGPAQHRPLVPPGG